MTEIKNKILLRQLKKAKITDLSSVDEKSLEKLFTLVERTYNDMDETIYRLERSLRISTSELQDLNENLEKKIIEEVAKNRDKDKKLIEQSRSAALGEMIGNIAHQWRQPLSAISSTSSSMLMQNKLGLNTKDDMIKSYEKILEYTNFLTQTIEDFRDFFKKDKDIDTFNIVEFFKKTINIISSSYKNNNIEIINNLPDKPMYSEGYPNEVTQVFLNVLNNARDILIEKKLDRNLVFIDYDYSDNFYCITITDNAGGVPPKIINKIFDPYFTTKHKSQGTGIGLYMCKQIIEKHSRGTISVENKEYEYEGERHKGACFNICLKRSDNE